MIKRELRSGISQLVFLTIALSIKALFLTSLITVTTANLATAGELAKSNSNENAVNNLLLKGKQLYDRGRLADAVKAWETGRKYFQQTQQVTNLIHSNNFLATAYQDLGNWDLAKKAIADNLALIESANSTVTRRNTAQIDSALLYAQTLNTQGSWQLRQGKGETAFKTWQETEAIYRDLEDTTGMILSQINQAQALQSLGFYRRSQKTLLAVREQLTTLPDSSLKISALQSLGVSFELSGDIERSEAVLKQSLAISKKINSPNDIAEAWFRLGNVVRSQKKYNRAIEYYQKAIAISPNTSVQLEAKLNQLSLYVETQDIANARQLIAPIAKQLDLLPTSRTAIYARVNYAQSLIEMDEPQVEQLLKDTVKQSQALEDNIAQAYAIGELGHWQELSQNYQQALNSTDRALALASATNQAQVSATLHWQRGRILKQEGKKAQAIAAYQSAVTELENLHQDLVAVNPELKLSFRQQIEPIYRQLVELLLENVEQLNPQQKQAYLEQSRLAIEALQQRELENYFRIACLDINQQNIDQIDSQAAVIYPILLDQSIEVILSIPGQPLKHYSNQIDSELQAKTFDDLLQYLNPVFSSRHHLPTAQKLYDWIVRPAEAELEQNRTDTLVFVLDKQLRSLPMSVLHDGEKYLLEQYNLALTPGLQLLPTKSLDTEKLKVLTGGLTESRQGFSALPGVEQEIASIQSTLPTNTLLNSEFTNPKIQEKVTQESAAIVHLATHGQFSSNAEDTYILTWDDRINVNDFDKLLSNRNNSTPIELLVLSACKTAAGDEGAILGLAGMAVRSGARTTMATLWSVNDNSTAKLMTEFYRYLSQSRTKSQAMRQAQLSLLQSEQYHHPFYWSPFVLVGNWK
ncbi:MAG: CHAT domain-containing protein [Cyanobacteria bacterium J06643_13]